MTMQTNVTLENYVDLDIGMRWTLYLNKNQAPVNFIELDTKLTSPLPPVLIFILKLSTHYILC